MDYKRATRRSEIRLRCPCRTHDGLPLEIELLDLSQRGCRARGIADVLHVGQALRLFPEGCEAVAATVRRKNGDEVGIEFDRELPPPVFERMRCYSPVEEAEQPDYADHSGAMPGAIEQAPVAAPQVTHQAYASLLGTVKDKPRARKIAIF